MFKGKIGLEIGGPSKKFTWKGNIPLYRVAKRVDGCNFSSSTIWEGEIDSSQPYKYKNRVLGLQHIADATDLERISDGQYDFVLSCHSLEHIANPLKAMKEWIRVLSDDGMILLVLPNKEYCFDHNRHTTTFSHLLEDLERDMGEDDMTHFKEALELHDIGMDHGVENWDHLKARSLKNFENRAMHHHVFDMPLLIQIMEYLGLTVQYQLEINEFIILGQKFDGP